MCYSAMIEADYRRYVREWGAAIDIRTFVDIFWWKWDPDEIYRRRGKPNVPRALEQAFLHGPGTDDERTIARYIAETRNRLAIEWQQELFAQRARLVKAEQQLAARPTKAAAESKRIANDKMARLKGWLDDLTRPEAEERDSRIFPGWFAPVLVSEGGQRVVKLMRYQCRPAGKPASHDVRFPATYNARRDNLEGFWKGQFGHTHGLVLASRFYEHVDRNGQDVVLEFNPQGMGDMLAACLWSRWEGPGGETLLSFAAITDEPPPEVAAAGHDRCIIPIKAEHVAQWLSPDPADKRAQYAILDDRERPYYEHRLAA